MGNAKGATLSATFDKTEKWRKCRACSRKWGWEWGTTWALLWFAVFFGFGLIKGQFFKYRKEKRKEKSLRGRGGGLRRSGGAPGADLACKRHRHVQSWLLESPNFL